MGSCVAYNVNSLGIPGGFGFSPRVFGKSGSGQFGGERRFGAIWGLERLVKANRQNSLRNFSQEVAYS